MKFKITSNKFDVFYVVTINILPILFFWIFDWSAAEFFLYFLAESIIIASSLIFRDFVIKNDEKLFVKIFINLFIFVFYLFTIFLLTSFFTEIGLGNDLNKLLYSFFIINWYESLLPIILLELFDILNFYIKKQHKILTTSYTGVLVGRVFVYFFLLFPSIIILSQTHNPIVLILYPVIIRLLYNLDGRIKPTRKPSPFFIFRFTINFFIFLFLIMYIFTFFNGVRFQDIVVGIIVFGFLLWFRRLVYNFNKD